MFRRACQTKAEKIGSTHWAQPVRNALGLECWYVFELDLWARRSLITEKPSQEAAEMWLIHLG